MNEEGKDGSNQEPPYRHEMVKHKRRKKRTECKESGNKAKLIKHNKMH